MDAFQAVALAEASGGRDIRVANPANTSVTASLEMIKNYNHRLAWVVTYSYPGGSQKFTVDATSGDVLD